MTPSSSAKLLRFRRPDAEPIAYQVRRGVASRQELLELWDVVKAADARLRDEESQRVAPASARATARERAAKAWQGGSAA